MDNVVRLLLVEDSEPDAELVIRELQKGGHHVNFKRVDTEPAFVAALDEEWDLIISDHSMPTFTGLRAFMLYQEHGLDIPFIFVSGALGEERAVEAMQAGARDYILKGNLGRLNVAVDRELAESEHRKAKRDLDRASLREQKRLSVALQATGAGIFEYRTADGGDHDDEHNYFSPRFAEILGYSEDQQPAFVDFVPWFFEHIHEEDVGHVKKCHEEFIAGQARTYAVDFRVCHPDGSCRNVACFAEAASRDTNGNVTDLVGVMLDQTDSKKIEDQYRQAQKMEAVGRLAGGVAHDFNNLLTVISNFGEFVLETLEPGSNTQQDMQEVLNAAERAAKLTDQLLAFSRKKPVDPQVLDVNGAIDDIGRMLIRLLGEDIDYETDLAPDLWSVVADRGGLEQVIVNLAINARDALHSGGRLSIETCNAEIGEEYDAKDSQIAPGPYVIIAVTDNGIGMDAETQQQIFEPFFTTKESDKGTGLGLATVYGIVRQAGGFIGVYSETGVGTTFRIYFPRAGEGVSPASGIEAEPESELPRQEGTVLLVEDEEPVRKLIVRILSQLGYDVLEASNGVLALEVAESSERPISLVLTDVVMPEMGGPELVERLASLYPDMKAIFMSGYTRGAVDLQSEVPLLQKPFSYDALATKLREVQVT